MRPFVRLVAESHLRLDLSANDTGSVPDHDAQIENLFARFDLNSLLNFPVVSLDPQNRQAVQALVISFQIDECLTGPQSRELKTSVRRDRRHVGNSHSQVP